MKIFIETEVKDGEYKLFTEMYDYKNGLPTEDDTIYRWESDSYVTIKDNYIDFDQLSKVTNELTEKSGYWGIFVEEITFDKKENAIKVGIGS